MTETEPAITIARLLLEHVPAAVAMFDRDMRYLAYSRRWLVDYRIEEEDIIGRSHYDVFPEIPDRWREVLQRAIRGETLSCEEDSFLRRDGSIDWVQWEIVPWRDEAGEIGGVILFTQVINERVEARRALEAATRELAERQELMHIASESLTDALFLTDAKGKVIRYNTAYAAFHRCGDREEYESTLDKIPDLVELRLLDGRLAPPEEMPVLRALRGETGTSAQFQLRRKDTGESWIGSYNFAPIRDANGEIVGSAVVARDVTAERRLQQELVESSDRAKALAEELDLLIDGARDYAIYMLDQEGHVAIWNDGAERLTGWSESEVKGANLSIFYTPADREAALPKSDLLRARRTGGFSEDALHMRKDGSAFIAQKSFSPLHGEDGELKGYCLVVHDVSEQRENELRLSVSASHFRSILATVPDAMVVIDAEGLILSFSAAAEKMFGYAETEVIGKNVSLLMPSPYREEHDSYIRRLRQAGQARLLGSSRTFAGVRSNGETFPLELHVGEASYDGHTIYTGFLRDLTEQQRNAARLDDLRKQLIRVARVSAMGTMASTLAHELNQPIAAVNNYIEGVRNLLTAPDPTVANALEQASSEAMRAGRIVRQLRAFVARGEVEKGFHSLSDVVDEALEFAGIAAREKGVSISVELAAAVDSVIIDRVQIEQVLINLVRNAVDALEDAERKSILISSAPEDSHYVRVTVADTGNGLSPGIAERLFHAFVSTKEEGMGLGLSICRTIVEANGGRIWYEPRPGGGSMFHFTLPLDETERSPDSEKITGNIGGDPDSAPIPS